jgi:Sulfotransferase domain
VRPATSQAPSEPQSSPRDHATPEGGAFPVFVDPAGRPCFRIERGHSAHRVLLTSIPKSGTYLFGELFKNLGFVDSGIHVEGRDGQSFTDYRFTSMREARENPHLKPISWPLSRTLGLILPGQYVVSHLQVTEDMPPPALTGFKVVFACRNLRDCLVSLMLFLFRTASQSEALAPLMNIQRNDLKTLFMLKQHGEHLLGEMNRIMNILNRGDVLQLRFEDALISNDEHIRANLMRRVVEFLDVDVDDTEGTSILNKTLRTDTMTKSAQPSNFERYWSPEVEREFARMGGCDLNRRLGYQ